MSPIQRTQLDLLIECLEGRDHQSELQMWSDELGQPTSQVKGQQQIKTLLFQRGYSQINTARVPESIKKKGNEMS